MLNPEFTDLLFLQVDVDENGVSTKLFANKYK